ncbi:hypothetical protein V6N11_028399 [Hibiscus sabdariffa]|uniref:Uncharacterized protein n=1 Tax=Hibiscus sabdariffa TaxID=183260 RepID=A0ABR2NQE9_9ROSI
MTLIEDHYCHYRKKESKHNPHTNQKVKTTIPKGLPNSDFESWEAKSMAMQDKIEGVLSTVRRKRRTKKEAWRVCFARKRVMNTLMILDRRTNGEEGLIGA